MAQHFSLGTICLRNLFYMQFLVDNLHNLALGQIECKAEKRQRQMLLPNTHTNTTTKPHTHNNQHTHRTDRENKFQCLSAEPHFVCNNSYFLQEGIAPSFSYMSKNVKMKITRSTKAFTRMAAASLHVSCFMQVQHILTTKELFMPPFKTQICKQGRVVLTDTNHRIVSNYKHLFPHF